MATTSSAPGKVYLFGEHAVVYGEPAIPCAIARRATVTVDGRADGRLRVEAEDLSLDGFTVEYGQGESPDVDVPTPLVQAAVGYVEEAVAQARDAIDEPDAGFDVTIESDIPLGAGLGSSAAVVVAAIDAATRSRDVTLAETELADRAYQVEATVQEGKASRADTFCSTMGSAVRVEGDQCQPLEDVPDLPMVVGYDGGAGDTGALVADVRRLREAFDVAADVVETIGDVTRAGADALDRNDVAELGELMDLNHGLLAALGVSGRSLEEMVWTSRDAGAAGAKLTGAGGAGCIVALDDSDASLNALQYLSSCEEAFRADLDREGVRRR